LRKQKKQKPIDATKGINPSGLAFAYRNNLKPRTTNQNELVRTIAENVITFCQGVAGSGKTHIAVGMALEYLLEGKVNKIIITRPVVESGEKLGFLPGTAEEKLHPYLLPILDEISYFIPMSQYGSLKTQHKIEIVPLGLMRGRNFHNAFIVADECQNASYDQLKMLLTRIGNDSKMVLTGDVSQSDLQRYLRGGFMQLISSLTDIDGIGMSELHSVDIIRNPIIGKILSRLESVENETQT
jgi:phosphate starvation-inducible protein PhoH and related proteins